MDLCDAGTVRRLLGIYALKAKKKLGQNFLVNREIVEKTALLCCGDSCDPAKKTVLEIGPGMGALTTELAKRYSKVVAVELDSALIPVLRNTLCGFQNVDVINADILKCDLSEIAAPYTERGISVCANLPYYITTPILMRLLHSKIPFEYITVMVQSEVAQRFCANPGDRNCGSITAAIAYYGKAEKILTAHASDFFPRPEVDSAVIRIRLHADKPYKPKSEKVFFRTVKGAFAQRRKTLLNSLSSEFTETDKETLSRILAETGTDEKIRGEKLSMDELTMLSDAIYARLGDTV